MTGLSSTSTEPSDFAITLKADIDMNLKPFGVSKVEVVRFYVRLFFYQNLCHFKNFLNN